MQLGDKTAAIPLAEERLVVSKRPVERRVSVRTVTDHVEETLREEVIAEAIDIRHVAVERQLTERPAIRYEGETMVIPVIEERLVVEKRIFLIEEIHVRRVEHAEQIEMPVSLRRQRAVVERTSTTSQLEEE